jgi:hypothetical protein
MHCPFLQGDLPVDLVKKGDFDLLVDLIGIEPMTPFMP